MYRFIIHKNDDVRKANAIDEIQRLDPNKKWRVEITQYRKRRSIDQNAFLHGPLLDTLRDHTGIEKDDLKTFLLGEYFGWREVDISGSGHSFPQKRSSQLDTSEFSAWMEWIEMWASKTLGVILPRPGDYA